MRLIRSVCVSLLLLAPIPALAANTMIYLTSGTTWTVPSNWNSSSNSVEVIGGGGGGAGADSDGNGSGGGPGGGGGAYSKVTNITLTPGGTVSYAVGSGGAGGGADATSGGVGGDTYFCNSTSNCASLAGSAVVVGAKGGGGGTLSMSPAAGGAGGASASGVGTTKNSGGKGGDSNYCGNGGSGGGGAAGTHGAGSVGNPSSTGGCGAGGGGGNGGGGGSGDAGSGGSGGNGSPESNYDSTGGTGSTGTEWDGSHGSGGGGGGGSGDDVCGEATSAGGAGGQYGAGGGGGGADAYGCSSGDQNGGAGKQGIIVITYTLPSSPRNITVSASTTVIGNVTVVDNISKGSGTFVIDDPIDPANKLLYHSFVESPDALDEYVGTTTIGTDGTSRVTLPAYFEALNGEYNYFIRPIDRPMPNLHVAQEVQDNAFVIGGGTPGGSVSWMVTGVRHDPYILAHPIVPEVEKGPSQLVDKGEYLHPESAPSCRWLGTCLWQWFSDWLQSI